MRARISRTVYLVAGLALTAASAWWVVGHEATNRPASSDSDSDSGIARAVATGSQASGTLEAGSRATSDAHVVTPDVMLCQAYAAACQVMGPCAPRPIWGVDCARMGYGGCTELGWDACGPINWGPYSQGEYVGPARSPHVSSYRYRVDDQLVFLYTLTRRTVGEYHLQLGDTVQTIALIPPAGDDGQTPTGLNLSLPVVVVQPDGTIKLPLLRPIPAEGFTIQEFEKAVNKAYSKYYRQDPVTILPVLVNTRLEDLRDSVDARGGVGGQRILLTVSPDGTVQLPMLKHPVPVQGLSWHELKQEVDARYAEAVPGIEITPILQQRAPRFVYVVGEVAAPGRITLTGPTTVMQAIAQAGSFNGLNANLRQVVVFRRGNDWRLMATILDLQGALYGRRPCPADEVWLRDSDVVVVPKTPASVANEWIEQVFTRGIYSVVPQGATGIGINFSTSTSL